jgi:hypothetical protein
MPQEIAEKLEIKPERKGIFLYWRAKKRNLKTHRVSLELPAPLWGQLPAIAFVVR